MSLDWLKVVLTGSGDPAHPSVAHTVFVLAAVIAFGIALSRIKIKGVSLGMTWILFVGIAFGHFLPSGTIHPDTLHFIKVRMRWPNYWSFSFSIIPSKEHPGLISFRMDWLDLLAVQGTLKSLLYLLIYINFKIFNC